MGISEKRKIERGGEWGICKRSSSSVVMKEDIAQGKGQGWGVRKTR